MSSASARPRPGSARREPPSSPTHVVAARYLLPRPGEWVEGGGLSIVGGRVERVLRSRAAVRRAERAAGRPAADLGSGVLVPGLVNAHAHLELSGLPAELPSEPFLAWVGELMAQRGRRGAARLRRDAERGAARLLASGTTTVGDIDSTGAGAAAAGGGPLRVRLYRELLDAWRPERTAETLAGVARALAPRQRRLEGLSPHGCHTASLALLAATTSLSRRRRAPVTIHWSETADEVRWTRLGTGPWSELLGPSPRRRGLDLLEEAGLLGPGTALVHGNHPARGEPARLASSGAVLVHCPGTHAFFERGPFPWRTYLRAGVTLALGTDSLASNRDLDMRREMALARRSAPWLEPRAVLEMATSNAARAVGLAREVGTLAPGARADWALHDPGDSFSGAHTAFLERLTAGATAVQAVAVGGRRVRSGLSIAETRAPMV